MQQGGTNPCAECCARTGPATRLFMLLTLVMTMLSLLVTTAFYNYPAGIVDTYFLGVYRLLFVNFVGLSFFNSLLGALLIWQTGLLQESRKGSAAFAYTFMRLGVTAGALGFLLCATLAYSPLFGWEVMSRVAITGPWMVLLAFYTQLSFHPDAPPTCLCGLPTKSYPFIMLVMISLGGGVSSFISGLMGVLVGILWSWFPSLVDPSDAVVHSLEEKRWFKGLLRPFGEFITADAAAQNADTMQMGGMFGPGMMGRMAAGGAPAGGQPAAAPSQNAAPAAPTRASVFDSGPGYRLGGDRGGGGGSGAAADGGGSGHAAGDIETGHSDAPSDSTQASGPGGYRGGRGGHVNPLIARMEREAKAARAETDN